MDLISRQEKDVLIVYLQGPLSVDLASRFENDLNSLIEKYPGSHMLLNFQDIDYITSIILRIITSAAKKLRNNNKALKLCNVNSIVHRVFEITNIIQIVDIQLSEEEALESYGGE